MTPPNQTTEPETIAVIGEGMGAAMLTAALAEARSAPKSLLLIDPAPHSGEAYARAAPEHFLNTRARVMGLTAATEGGFVPWLAARLDIPDKAAAVAFAPRALYGAFVQEGAAAARERLTAAGWRVRRAPVRALGARREGGRFFIETSGQPIAADQIVLAIGPARGAPMAGAISPWSLDAFHAKARRVTVIGSGLTAADAVVRLAALGFDGAVVMASLTGDRPIPQAEGAPPPAPMTPPLGVSGAADLVRAFRDKTRQAQAEGFDWRAAMDALRPLTADLWAGLPAPTRARLLRSDRMQLWNRLRHRLPTPTARALDTLVTAGRLQFRKGRVETIADGVITYADGATEACDLVIDARGFDLGFRREPLVQSLIAGGVARPCPTGFGLAPDRDLRVGDGGVYALGAVLSGALLETTAAAEIRAQAGTIARALTRASSPRHQ